MANDYELMRVLDMLNQGYHERKRRDFTEEGLEAVVEEAEIRGLVDYDSKWVYLTALGVETLEEGGL